MKNINVILDGDPGHDDAIAWLLAKSSSLDPDGDVKLNIKAVTSVGGNVNLQKTTYNTLRVCTLLGIDAPIAAGAAGPLCCELMSAPSVHGESGLDGPALPEPAMELSELTALELMAKVLTESEEKCTIISTGPLTNTAQLLLTYPELKGKIERISLMGGGITHGNWTPAAEFNILVDPEAAKLVFESGIPIIMSGLDVTERALMKPADFEKIGKLSNPVSRIVKEWLEFFHVFHKNLGYEGAPMHDPCAVMVLLHPEIFEMKSMYVAVDTEGEYTRGATVPDRFGHLGKEPNAEVVMGLDLPKFTEYLVKAVSMFG